MMKKMSIILFFLFQLSSFGQDKNYEKLFDDCKKTGKLVFLAFRKCDFHSDFFGARLLFCSFSVFSFLDSGHFRTERVEKEIMTHSIKPNFG